jgi:hypothetical protein
MLEEGKARAVHDRREDINVVGDAGEDYEVDSVIRMYYWAFIESEGKDALAEPWGEWVCKIPVTHCRAVKFQKKGGGGRSVFGGSGAADPSLAAVIERVKQ